MVFKGVFVIITNCAPAVRYFPILTAKGKRGTIWCVKRKGRLRSFVALVAISCMAIVAICCGHIVCLCSDDPDGCGEPCHVCGEKAPIGLSVFEPCNHFSFSSVDFWTEDCDVTTVAVADTGYPLYRIRIADTAVSARPPYRSRAHPPNAPPGRYSDSALFRVRRVLLLS